MAKPKNAPALFEVIRSAQEKQRKEQERQKQLAMRRELSGVIGATGESEHLATSLLRAPLFWFKGKQALAEHAAKNPQSAEASIPVARAAASLASTAPSRIDVAEEARRLREEIAATAEPVSAPMPEPQPVVFTPAPVPTAAPVEPVVETHVVEPAPAVHDAPPYDDVPASIFDARAAEPVQAVQHDVVAPEPAAAVYDLDPVLAGSSDQAGSASAGRERFVLPLNYTTGILAGCGVLLLCGVAYLAASLGSSGPSRALADQAPNPKVLEVAAPTQAQPVVNTRPTDSGPLARQTKNPAETTAIESVKPIPVPTNVKRAYNMQYIVVLSSPIAKEAQDAVKFLADNGIPATAEQALPGYSRTWYSVITTKGFERTRNNPEYDAYVAQLTKVMQRYAKSSKWKTFQPDVYTWRVK